MTVLWQHRWQFVLLLAALVFLMAAAADAPSVVILR